MRKAAAIALLLLCASFGVTSRTCAADSANELRDFWPLDASPRTWNLVRRDELHTPHPEIRMTVVNETLRPGVFMLWFSHKHGQPAGKRDGEQYRLCKTAGLSWLYLDAYIDAFAGKPPIRHDVVSDRIVFTPATSTPQDLIADGSYAACGETGQPYLVWSGGPASYRIQVWGHLTENAKFRWYWDATVTHADRVVNDGLAPGREQPALRVEEAWWCSFKNPNGQWELGTGGSDTKTGAPTGTGVTYGRTVWHGTGQLPYTMIHASSASTGSDWCVNEVVPRGP